ncbi:MAG: Omp28-related outer membrane protein [Bacteroidales bacterium]|nr:Omp28-related outer membrane protein [Bacteroidales bacterium]
MKKLFYILPLAAMMFAACDKIAINEAGYYGTEAGASGEWVDGNGVVDKSQRAYVEKFTGAKCVNCPDGDQTLNTVAATYGDKMVAVAIDSPGSLGNPYNGFEDMRTEDGSIWAEYFGGVEQIPAYMVNRQAMANIAMSNLATDVAAATAQQAKIAVAVSNTMTGDNASIKVDIEFVEKVDEALTLTLLIMEDSLVYKQLSPDGPIIDYVHNHELRDVITDVWGADIAATGAAGEKKCATFKYKVDSKWVKEHCHIIAFVSNKATKKVYNAAECELINE